jgi:amidase
MGLRPPEPDQIRQIAGEFGIDMTVDHATIFALFMLEMCSSYEYLDGCAEQEPGVGSPRHPGYRPASEDNCYNAWFWKTEISGAVAQGRLAGKRVAVKDNICVAGIPMMNGSKLLNGYVPDIDATVITRILEEGGRIVGKTVCEDLCLSGASHTGALGPVRNPHQPSRSSGGSSSGSAVVVAIGEADSALGGDQGGSIRIPASWCGIYGLKPSYGLVPYTGIFPIEMTLDHCGPMARSLEELALLLEVIAGPDGLDPRQGDVTVQDYVEAVRHPFAAELRIGVVEEGFGHPESDPSVDAVVRAAAQRFADLGASVEEVSIPMHMAGSHIHGAIIVEGSTELMLRCNGVGTNWQGYYPTTLAETFARSWRARPNELGETAKLNLLMSEYMRRAYHGHYYAKAQNMRRILRDSYNGALCDFDLLLMPTVPFQATEIPPDNACLYDVIARARDRIDVNTCPFDVTGHPALNVPCGFVNDLPVGMMLIGRTGEDATPLRAAQFFSEM